MHNPWREERDLSSSSNYLSIILTAFIIEDEEDANTVFMTIKKKAAKYAEIGRGFGLAPSTIESIRDNHPRDNSGALQDVITTWIRQEHNTKKFGLPSWQKVVEAIGEVDKSLARKIAKDHPIQSTTGSYITACVTYSA